MDEPHATWGMCLHVCGVLSQGVRGLLIFNERKENLNLRDGDAKISVIGKVFRHF